MSMDNVILEIFLDRMKERVDDILVTLMKIEEHLRPHDSDSRRIIRDTGTGNDEIVNRADQECN